MGSHLPETRLVRLLLAVIGVIGVATLVGVIALWPRGERDIRFEQLGRESLGATVTASGAPCVTVTVTPCQRVTARLSDGRETSFDVIDSVTFDDGDRIRVMDTGAPPEFGTTPLDQYAFSDFERRTPMLWLALAFAAALIATTRWRGLRALVALGFSLALVVFFVVPAIARGSSPLLVALVGALAITLVTIPIAYGLGPKSLAAIAGTGTSLLLTVILAEFATGFTHLTGRASEEALLIQAAPGAISIVGLLIAGIVIGALGVLDDLTVSQASTVMALRRANPALGFRELFRGALSVGNDHIVATVNTLVLAYAGAALPTLLIFSASDAAFGASLTSEVVAADVVSMLVGSLGLIAAVPVTTAIAAALAVRVSGDSADLAGDGHDHHH